MRIHGRTHHTLVSLWGDRWREGSVGYFTTFLDDSGTDPRQPVAISSVLIIPSGTINRLGNEWNNLKNKEGFKDFHTSEFVARNERSDFVGWDDTKHRRVFARVRQIIKKYGVKVFSFAVKKDDYDEVVCGELRKYIGQYHYTWAVRHTVLQMEEWRIRNKAHPFMFIFDWMEPGTASRNEIENVMKQSERAALENGEFGIYTKYTFEHRAQQPGLQCVDCLAWMCFGLSRFSYYKTPLHPYAQVARQDLFSMNSGDIAGSTEWLSFSSVSRAELGKWVAEEMADQQSVARFKRWEQEDKHEQKIP